MSAAAENTYRSTLPAELAGELRAARAELGLSLRETARRADVPHGHLSMLERALRCPSTAVAQALIGALELDDDVAARLLAVAKPNAGRCSLYRSVSSVRR